jgi:predicted Zn-dependent protease
MLARGRTAAAANEYQRALQASPNSPVILSKLGRVMIETHRVEEALPLFKKALDVDPDSANAMVQLGRAYHATKKFAEGRDTLEEAIQINPFNPMIYRLLVDTYAALGAQEKARQAKLTLERLTSAN